MIKKTHLYAKNIPIGATVSIYNENWVCSGPIKIFDGDFEFERIMLSSLRSPSLYTFVFLDREFSFYQSIYSDCEEIPF